MKIVISLLACLAFLASGFIYPGNINLLMTELPGPSQALFNAPMYQCVRNFYVATTGNNANNGSIGAPWLTIQKANDQVPSPGDCINVSPGTYANGAVLSNGGNLASPTGYVVYRCTTMDACTITENDHAFEILNSASSFGPSYIVIDGFTMAASSQVGFGQGVEMLHSGDSAFCCHHIWITNNIISGYGQSGLQMNDGEYFFIIHNTSHDNSHVTCGAQGSGFSLASEKPISTVQSYTPTAQDLLWAPYHHVIMWNVSHDNNLSSCGSGVTDGNGYIMDDWANQGTSNVDFGLQALLAFNIAYMNGGRGFAIERTSRMTVANNVAYSDMLDIHNNATFRPEMDLSGSINSTYENNIAWSVPGASPTNVNSAFGGGDSSGITNSGNSWNHNISFGGTPSFGNNNGNAMFNAEATNFTCSANKCNVDPKLQSVTTNFALQSTSPAIGYGLSQVLLSGQSIDAGPCFHVLTQCP